MNYAIGLSLVLAISILSGCKATAELEVSVLDLFYSKTRMIPADFYTEVAGCNDTGAPAATDQSLAQRRNAVEAVITDAEYLGCNEDGDRAIAHFRIPIALDKDQDGKLASDEHINLISTDDAFLTLTIPEALRDRLQTSTGIDLRARSLPIDVKIRINNDHGNALPIQVFSVYVDDRPFIFGDTWIPKVGGITLRLSDLTIDNAIETGSSVLLMRNTDPD